jgi:rhodanese-related sulfurtransferase
MIPMTLPTAISPETAQALMRNGAQLIDIRESDERAAGVIEGARSLPLSSLQAGTATGQADQVTIFHCRTGRRTTANAPTLQAAAGRDDILVLEGGLDAWAAAGLPVVKA